MKNFTSKILDALISEYGYTLPEIAKLLNVSPSSLYEIQNESLSDLETIEKILYLYATHKINTKPDTQLDGIP